MTAEGGNINGSLEVKSVDDGLSSSVKVGKEIGMSKVSEASGAALEDAAEPAAGTAAAERHPVAKAAGKTAAAGRSGRSTAAAQAQAGEPVPRSLKGTALDPAAAGKAPSAKAPATVPQAPARMQSAIDGASDPDNAADIGDEAAESSRKAGGATVGQGWQQGRKAAEARKARKAQGEIGAVGEKGPKTAKGGVDQTKRNFLASRRTTEKAAAAKTRRSIGGVMGRVAAAAGPVLLAVLAGLALALMIASLAASMQGANRNYSGMTDNERTVAAYLAGKHVDNTHIAAIMGNMAHEDTTFDPSVIQDDAAPFSGEGMGICQWTSSGRQANLAMHAQELGKEWNTFDVQLDLLWDECANGQYFTEEQWNEFLSISDVAEATDYFEEVFERPAVIQDRSDAAQKYLDILNSGGDTTGVIAVAKTKIGDPWVSGADGPDSFDCSGFVYYCFNQCGYNLPRYDADQFYNASTHISESEAQPGDIVCYDEGWINPGETMGHIAIYAGNGMVYECASGVGYDSISYCNGNHYFGRLSPQ